MKTRQSGKYIVIEDESEKAEMLELYCTCGHALKDHFFFNTYGSKKTFETGACLKSNHCQQFELAKQIKAERYYYARQ